MFLNITVYFLKNNAHLQENSGNFGDTFLIDEGPLVPDSFSAWLFSGVELHSGGRLAPSSVQ